MFPKMLRNLGKKLITDLAIPVDRDNLTRLAISLVSDAIKKFEEKSVEKEL